MRGMLSPTIGGWFSRLRDPIVIQWQPLCGGCPIWNIVKMAPYVRYDSLEGSMLKFYVDLNSFKPGQPHHRFWRFQ